MADKDDRMISHCYSWGANSYGQLGIGNSDDQLSPVPFKHKIHSKITGFAGGGMQSFLITDDGGLEVCGACQRARGSEDILTFTPVAFPTRVHVTSVAGGWDFALALTDSRALFVWGSNRHGQLGLGPQHRVVEAPVRSEVVDVRLVAAGMRHAVAVTGSSTVYSWGVGRKGQLGVTADDGTALKKSFIPVKVGEFEPVRKALCGSQSSLLLLEDGSLRVWGDNTRGQLALPPSSHPSLPVPSRPEVKPLADVAAGWTHCLALDKQGQLMTWGRNDYCQLGRAAPAAEYRPAPVEGAISRVRSIHCGAEFCAVNTADGALYLWGWNEHGMCGDGTEINRQTPARVPIEEPVVLVGGGVGWVVALVGKPV